MSPPSLRRAQAYASVSLDSRADGSGPHEVVLMLYEGLLERIQLGKRSLEQQDMANKFRHIDRAIQILSEGLRTHLDLKAGGELAQHLDALYGYCLVRLLDANAHNDAGALDEVYRLLAPVADAWRISCSGPESAPGSNNNLQARSPSSVGAPAATPTSATGSMQRNAPAVPSALSSPVLRFAA